MGIQPDADYKCSLSLESRKVAKEELREDDATREHAIEQFREWISKHPSIKRCRTDSVFLLRFLRTKKFSLPMAQEMLEKNLKVRQLHSDIFRNLYVDDPDIEAIVDGGYAVPMPKRDKFGRVILLGSPGRLDPYKFTYCQSLRVYNLAMDACMEDEETQVNGFVHIYDQEGFTMGHVSSWSLTTLRNMVVSTQKAIPMRHKEIHIVNLPGVAGKFMEFAMSMLNKKLQSRVKFHKTVEDLHKFVDPKLLPKEYGGDVPLAEMIVEYKNKLRKKRDAIKALDDMHIEISLMELDKANADLGGELAGSFRKLEVD